MSNAEHEQRIFNKGFSGGEMPIHDLWVLAHKEFSKAAGFTVNPINDQRFNIVHSVADFWVVENHEPSKTLNYSINNSIYDRTSGCVDTILGDFDAAVLRMGQFKHRCFYPPKQG